MDTAVLIIRRRPDKRCDHGRLGRKDASPVGRYCNDVMRELDGPRSPEELGREGAAQPSSRSALWHTRQATCLVAYLMCVRRGTVHSHGDCPEGLREGKGFNLRPLYSTVPQVHLGLKGCAAHCRPSRPRSLRVRARSLRVRASAPFRPPTSRLASVWARGSLSRHWLRPMRCL